jgi:predicted component of type VI protein secretion system
MLCTYECKFRTDDRIPFRKKMSRLTWIVPIGLTRDKPGFLVALGKFTKSHILAKKHKLILYYSTMVTRISSSERRSIRRPSQAPNSSYASPSTVLHRFEPSSTSPSHPEEEEIQYESYESSPSPLRTQFEGAETRDMMTMMSIDLDTMTSQNKPQPRQLPSSLYLPSF